MPPCQLYTSRGPRCLQYDSLNVMRDFKQYNMVWGDRRLVYHSLLPKQLGSNSANQATCRCYTWVELFVSSSIWSWVEEEPLCGIHCKILFSVIYETISLVLSYLPDKLHVHWYTPNHLPFGYLMRCLRARLTSEHKVDQNFQSCTKNNTIHCGISVPIQ